MSFIILYSNEREGRNHHVCSVSDASEQPKVVSGVCVANSQIPRYNTQSLKQLRSFQRNKTAKAVLDKLGKLNL